MGWELRRGKRYYYRKVRGADGRVRSIYCGTGERAEAAAREDERRRCATPKVAEVPAVEATLAPPAPPELTRVEQPAPQPNPPVPSTLSPCNRLSPLPRHRHLGIHSRPPRRR